MASFQDAKALYEAMNDANINGYQGESVDMVIAALADVLCWMNGFEAGRPGHEGPSLLDLKTLRELNIALKQGTKQILTERNGENETQT